MSETTLTEFRRQVADQVQADLRGRELVPANFTIRPGRIEGPVSREIGCCWSPGRSEREDNAHQELWELRIRIWKAYDKRRTDADPADLETIGEAIYDSLLDKQTDSFGVWFLRCVATTIEPTLRMVEVTVIAFQPNRFS